MVSFIGILSILYSSIYMYFKVDHAEEDLEREIAKYKVVKNWKIKYLNIKNYIWTDKIIKIFKIYKLYNSTE